MPQNSISPKQTGKLISSKPFLISSSDLLALGPKIKLVGIDPLQSLESGDTKSFSPRLLNWVEPYIISGFTKTLFYTEINSGLKIGDRVFIVNGNYDNDLLIKKDKYKKGRDGYKVLFINNCQIVLDIDYTGVSACNDDRLDDFIKVYYIKNEEEFLHSNRQITTRGGIFDYKFSYYQNNIIFVDQDFSGSNYWGKNTGLTGSPGFFVRINDGTYSWTNITTEIMSGSFSHSLSPTYYNNNTIKILNGSFTHDGFEFKEGFSYKWDIGPEPDAIPGTQSQWVVDVKYSNPILTKSNFRDGNFKGTWNTGLYGRQDKKITWDGDGKWNNGTLLNSTWGNGTIDSMYNLNVSYVAEFDENGIPYQKVNNYNNNGRGFNYIIDSEFEKSIINNGSIINTTIGDSSYTYSVVEDIISSSTFSYNNTINKGFFDKCKLSNSNVNNSIVNKTRSINTKFSNIKSINSDYKKSVIKDSNYLSDSVIKILEYDEFNISEYKGLSAGSTYSITNPSHKVYKFYIGKTGFDRLKIGDSFYLKGLKINDNTKDVIKFFDKRFRVGSWIEYTDDYLSTRYDPFYKRGVEYSSFLSTPGDNEWRYTSIFASSSYGFTGLVDKNTKSDYSIDIIVSIYDIPNPTSYELPDIDFDRGHVTPTSSVIIPESLSVIDFSNAYIIDSDFESGLFETSNWNNGRHINNNNDSNITIRSIEGGYYNMSISTASTLLTTTYYDSSWVESTEDNLISGDIVFLNGVDYDATGEILSMTISASGSGHTQSGIDISTTGGSGIDFTVDYTGSPGGGIISATISSPGSGYQIGDVIYINDLGGTSSLEVLSLTGSVTRLPDTYKILSNSTGNLELEEIITGTYSILSTLGNSGIFYTTDAHNRYGYIYKTKFNKSKIKSGLFRRSYIKESFIENEEFDVDDKEYDDIDKIRSLVISDSLFTNNSNILSKALYINSIIVGDSDLWENGLGQYLIWNGPTFKKGVIKQSRWIDGIFEEGIFYNSKSFDGSSSTQSAFYYTENIKSYYKDGLTTATISNDRYSWQNGTFSNGEFHKSDWENGVFNNGKFYHSKWYDGIFNNGIIGDIRNSTEDTKLYNGVINYAIVENATLYTIDTSYYEISSNNIIWNDGIFNGGVFGSDILQPVTHSSTWNDGIFNEGEFITNAKWKTGTFNGGKFISSYGWTSIGSSTQSGYGWEDGIFNGGEFGDANLATNSVWFTGEFNGGTFKGRYWNDGIFTSGQFQGSSTYSAVGGYNVIGMTVSNAYNFVQSYTQSYYGLWAGGYMTNIKDKFIKDKKTYTNIERSKTRIMEKSASFKNALWMSGTFSHQSGEFNNSIWLDGGFESGTFLNSAFNPYVIRDGGLTPSFNTNDDLVTGSGSCVWYNGRFDSSDFYISQWNQGRFLSGTAFGMVWKDGISNYMNAYNVFWENGTWRNGNWQGSYLQFNGPITDDFTNQLLYRGMDWSGTSSCHTWNIFKSESISDIIIIDEVASTPTPRTSTAILIP